MPAWPAPQSMKMGTAGKELDSPPREGRCEKIRYRKDWTRPLTPGPLSPDGGEGKVNIRFNSLGERVPEATAVAEGG